MEGGWLHGYYWNNEICSRCPRILSSKLGHTTVCWFLIMWFHPLSSPPPLAHLVLSHLHCNCLTSNLTPRRNASTICWKIKTTWRYAMRALSATRECFIQCTAGRQWHVMTVAVSFYCSRHAAPPRQLWDTEHSQSRDTQYTHTAYRMFRLALMLTKLTHSISK